MARLDPRVPSSLECDWLEKRLDKVGRGRYLSAKTLDQKIVRKEGLLQSRNRELLMSASSGGISTPREFSRLRRLRASLTAERQVAARRRKQELTTGHGASPRRSLVGVEDEEQQLIEEQAARDADAQELRAANEAADNARPDAGVGQIVRIRSNISKPAYGWGNLEGNAMGTVIQVRLNPRPKEPEKQEWHYLVELLESPYHHATTKARFWVSQYEIEGRRGHGNVHELTAEVLAKLAPESQTDWARIDRLATPKSRGDSGTNEPSPFLRTGATWSQSSGMVNLEAGSTVSSVATSTGGPCSYAFPFTPMTSPRSRKLAKTRRAQLQEMAQKNMEYQAPPRGGAPTAEREGEVESDSGTPDDAPAIRPQTSYGELLYRSTSNLALSASLDKSSRGSVVTWDVSSPQASKGSLTARAPLAPQLPQLPACSPRLRRTCSVYGVSPGRSRPRTTTTSRQQSAAQVDRVKPARCALHEHKPVPPMPPVEDGY